MNMVHVHMVTVNMVYPIMDLWSVIFSCLRFPIISFFFPFAHIVVDLISNMDALLDAGISGNC